MAHGTTRTSVGLETPDETSARARELLSAPKAEEVGGGLGGFSNLNQALDDAVALARSKRQSKELDLVGGAIPGGVFSGALPGSEISGFLKNLDVAGRDRSRETLDIVREQQDFLKDQKISMQGLGLKMLELGADAPAIQGILNAPDMDAAIAMAAGVIKSTTKDDLDIRQVGATLVSVDEEGNPEVLFDGRSSGGGSGGGGGTGFTNTQKNKLEAAGLLNAPREQQLDFLFGDEEEENTAEFDDAIAYADQFNGTDEELKRDLLQDSSLTVSEVDSIIDARKVPQEAIDTKAQELVQSNFSTSLFRSRDAELAAAKQAALADIDKFVQEVLGRELTPAEESALRNSINTITLDQINI